MIIIFNRYKSDSPPGGYATYARGAPGLLKCKSPPDAGIGDANTCTVKPPGSVLKALYNPRNGITQRPPVESRPGGERIQYCTTYDSFARGSLIKAELLSGCILPACSINRQGGRIISIW
jgi:hypothetical protein